MTAHLLLEEETGTSTGHRHPHNGYYAGDFTGRTDRRSRGGAALGGCARDLPRSWHA